MTPMAWNLLGRLSLVFADGRGGSVAEDATVIPAARALVHALRADLGRVRELEALPLADRQRLMAVARDVVAQLPELGDRLATAIDQWA
ncbi:MAG TPA: hypothetical protein VNP95_04960, partial [Thermomicrobiales bacterium]|nr:hypothetical protein [Thermomicrobiales bacterium]